MSDYTADGAVPVDDAVVDDPPIVDEVLEEQRRRYPAQASSHWTDRDALDDGLPNDSGGDAPD